MAGALVNTFSITAISLRIRLIFPVGNLSVIKRILRYFEKITMTLLLGVSRIDSFKEVDKTMADPKSNILFLCTGNSCRSQMAEGWARSLLGDRCHPWSAGIETHGLNPFAVTVMAEAGVDISGHQSKLLESLSEIPFSLVVTVCDHAQESCPAYPKKVALLHQSFPDPPQLAKSAATEKEALDQYRKVRDLIKEFIIQLPCILDSLPGN